ncbi:MAG TPA: carboxypeptidase-like regulatory domain-containing protein [Burkholderiaceae bacterium]|nr:carboxypeptidase-like regulatory domain-containing protein [Burkholderiaceae bacterium]
MSARVVMPDGQPIEGAIVLATWKANGWINNGSLGQVAIEEAMTDKNGQFRIPAWGPRFISAGMVNIEEPTIRVFHQGFVPLVLSNFNGIGMRAAPSIIKFRFQDKPLVLNPFHGSFIEYEKALVPLNNSLDFIIFDPPETLSGRCYWKAIPKMLVAVEQARISLVRKGAGQTLRSLSQYVMADKPECGNPKEFFQGLFE